MVEIPRDFDFKARPPCTVGFSSGSGSYLVDSHLAQDLAEIRTDGEVIVGRFEGMESFVPLDTAKVREGFLPRRFASDRRSCR